MASLYLDAERCRVPLISNETTHRNEQGTLKGFDQATNIVVEKCHERVFRGFHEGAQDVPLGLYVIRGDNLFVTHRGARRPSTARKVFCS